MKSLSAWRFTHVEDRKDSIEFCDKKQNGEKYWVSASISPVKSNRGVIANLIIIKDDITERRKMEEALLQSEKLKSVGTITAGVAHEFNNILAVISGKIQLLEMDYEDDKELTNELRSIMEAIDDDEEICNILKKYFERGGHKVQSVNNGADAIKLIEEEEFDLVLCDMVMLGIRGSDLVMAITKNTEIRPIIGVTTGWCEHDEVLDKAGANVEIC
ncbi:MAG: response regulator [Candidatus Brocadiaceae bacterium]|nr:response regulator [Candidatus Brocadiaceae bacterium]